MREIALLHHWLMHTPRTAPTAVGRRRRIHLRHRG